MAILPIRLYPDPVLRVDCPRVENFDEELERLVTDMIETMHDAPGVGLAAPQVGVELRVAVVDTSVDVDPDSIKVLVNPELVESSGAESDTEGCLSIPGLTEKVSRSTYVRLRYQDLEGDEKELEAHEFEARAMLHEMDHLDGVLFVDRLRGLRRERAKRFLKRLQQPAEATAGQPT